jgi:DNA-binding HxlR family transcriptional regulator
MPGPGRCPIDFALDVFGDRWTLLVIRDLIFAGKRHFRELIQSPEGIATNILAARLKKLEASGIISRHPDPENRRQVVYELTEKGLDLLPILIETVLWGAKYDPKTGAPKGTISRMRNNRDEVVNEITAALKQRRAQLVAKRQT